MTEKQTTWSVVALGVFVVALMLAAVAGNISYQSCVDRGGQWDIWSCDK